MRMTELIEETIFTFQTVETGHGYMVFILLLHLYMFQISHIRMLKRDVRALYQNIYMTGKTLKIKS